MAKRVSWGDVRDEIVASQGDHAIFAPSSSAGWLFCEDYIFANFGKPDNGNYDAAYGTVGHGVGERWLERIKAAMPAWTGELHELTDVCYPTDEIGRKETIHNHGQDFEIEIDLEMVSYVREYITWCMGLPGDHFIETRVDFSDLTPIPRQGGTADHSACRPRRMVITDLKMGKGIRVFAYENTQALLYAYGFFREFDWIYGFEEIEIRICQPRLEHYDTWTVTREELLAFAEDVKPRALAAWTPGGTRTPSPKSCQWCKDIDCAARLAVLHAETDDVFDDLTIEGEFRVIDAKAVTVAKTALDDGWSPTDRSPQTLTTEQLEKLLRLRKMIEKWFAAIEIELESRAADGEELSYHKLVPGREGNRKFASKEAAEEFCFEHGIDPMMLYKTEMLSPAQFEEVVRRELAITKKKAGSLLASAVIRAVGRQTLAPVSDDREALPCPGDVFDDLTADEL